MTTRDNTKWHLWVNLAAFIVFFILGGGGAGYLLYLGNDSQGISGIEILPVACFSLVGAMMSGGVGVLIGIGFSALISCVKDARDNEIRRSLLEPSQAPRNYSTASTVIQSLNNVPSIPASTTEVDISPVTRVPTFQPFWTGVINRVISQTEEKSPEDRPPAFAPHQQL